ncbi:hypothetical protein niasHT_017104 [Heterodera trifolii]|uniref:Uncharacterized protein n=1 Tax=Heterodera trifolii TaxID=157864 RepID=A0ABD2LEH7_9BILA
MSDRQKEAEEKMAKAIFISADCWLCVFELLPPRQLGLGIAMISHRFDFYVNEHFKTRKWTLKPIQIERKIGENVTKEMEIVTSHGKPLPIPSIQMPRKVIGFERIIIYFIDQNAIAFLRRFRQVFAACQINLSIHTNNDRLLELFLHNTWPMLEKKHSRLAIVRHIFPPFAQIRPVNSQRLSISSPYQCLDYKFLRRISGR